MADRSALKPEFERSALALLNRPIARSFSTPAWQRCAPVDRPPEASPTVARPQDASSTLSAPSDRSGHPDRCRSRVPPARRPDAQSLARALPTSDRAPAVPGRAPRVLFRSTNRSARRRVSAISPSFPGPRSHGWLLRASRPPSTSGRTHQRSAPTDRSPEASATGDRNARVRGRTVPLSVAHCPTRIRRSPIARTVGSEFKATRSTAPVSRPSRRTTRWASDRNTRARSRPLAHVGRRRARWPSASDRSLPLRATRDRNHHADRPSEVRRASTGSSDRPPRPIGSAAQPATVIARRDEQGINHLTAPLRVRATRSSTRPLARTAGMATTRPPVPARRRPRRSSALRAQPAGARLGPIARRRGRTAHDRSGQPDRLWKRGLPWQPRASTARSPIGRPRARPATRPSSLEHSGRRFKRRLDPRRNDRKDRALVGGRGTRVGYPSGARRRAHPPIARRRRQTIRPGRPTGCGNEWLPWQPKPSTARSPIGRPTTRVGKC
jgi:hypothetical protein